MILENTAFAGNGYTNRRLTPATLKEAIQCAIAYNRGSQKVARNFNAYLELYQEAAKFKWYSLLSIEYQITYYFLVTFLAPKLYQEFCQVQQPCILVQRSTIFQKHHQHNTLEVLVERVRVPIHPSMSFRLQAILLRPSATAPLSIVTQGSEHRA